ncbi:MAG TPA: DUF1707 domain-containing protein [Streptosporangiaceae bacterium]|nr:DUF1707 domain-containing protein [Streptosporangiaceae bacterium]
MSSGIRASDHDRDRTANLLREHHAVGRLDPEEFAERLDKSFHAKTVEELDRLTADLPAIDLYPLPTASLPKNRVVNTGLPAASVISRAGSGRAGSGRFSPGWLAAWGSWSVLFLIGFVVWVLGFGGWPLIGMAAIGVVMGGRWIMGPRAIGHGGSGRGELGDLRRGQLDGGVDGPTDGGAGEA